MILDYSKKFICLEYSNPEENTVINIITKLIFEKKQQSVINCGAKNNPNFASSVIPYSVFLLTVKRGLDTIQTDEFGNVTDTRLQAIYSDMKTEDFLNLITSYCFLKERTDFIEIWDVCIFLEERGRGVGNLLIQNALKLYTKNYWLFVVADNMPAAKLYIKNGFAVQNITQHDSSGMQIFSDTSVISMILNKQSLHTNIHYNIQLFNLLSDKILGFVKIETLNIKIDREVINFIDTIVKNRSISYEVGGSLLTKHTDRFNIRFETKEDGKSFIVLGMHKILIKGNSNTIGSTTSEYNFMFITQPISPLNYNGLVVQIPVDDITFCVQNMLYNISRLIKSQKFFIFSSDGVISFSISSVLTEFILTCLFQSLEKGADVRDEIFRYLQLCFNNLTTIKMLGIYQESMYTNQQLVLQGLQTSVKKQSGDLTCGFINRISIKDLADSDQVGVISSMLSIFFDQKGYLPVFSAKYHEILSSEGLYISCEDTVVPRNIADLTYSDENMVNSESFSREKVLSQLAGLPEFSQFVLE